MKPSTHFGNDPMAHRKQMTATKGYGHPSKVTHGSTKQVRPEKKGAKSDSIYMGRVKK